MSETESAHVILTVLDHAGDLKRLPRTGWLLAGIDSPESVAEHSFGVAILALLLAEGINSDPVRQGLDMPLDVGKVLRLALLHDLAESVLTDLPKRTTELLGASFKHAAEQQAMLTIMGNLPDGLAHVALWGEYDAQSTPEARLVKDADKLEMVYQAAQYARNGHTGLDEFWLGHDWNYPLSAEIFRTLQQRHGQ